MANTNILEAKINGKLVPFDGQSTNSRSEADAFYIGELGWQFLGEGKAYYANGILQSAGITRYFYARVPYVGVMETLENKVTDLEGKLEKSVYTVRLLKLINLLTTVRKFEMTSITYCAVATAYRRVGKNKGLTVFNPVNVRDVMVKWFSNYYGITYYEANSLYWNTHDTRANVIKKLNSWVDNFSK